jgi:hypothetical protein
LAKPDKEELQHKSTEWLDWFKCWFKEIKANLTKDAIIANIDLMTDFVKNYDFSPNDISLWKGRMLITIAEDDVIFKYFDGLKKLYPEAEYQTFPQGLGAHSLPSLRRRFSTNALRSFCLLLTAADKCQIHSDFN